MGRRQQAMRVVVAGCLALGGGSALAVDVTEQPPGRSSGDPGPLDAREKHYVEIPLGRHAPAAEGAAPPRRSDAKPKPPSTPQIDAAIRELGDADFRKREAAAKRLRAMGRSAVPALEHARDTATDPEVAARADAALRVIERPPASRAPGASAYTYRGVPQGRGELHGFQPLNGNLNLQLRQDPGGRRRVEVREAGGRIIRIDEGPAGIRMSVTTRENGEPVTRSFEAATAEQLKAKDKEAFELYNRWTGRAGGVLRPPAYVRPPFRPAPVLPGDEGGDIHERIREIRRQQRRQMREQQRLWREQRERERELNRAAGAELDLHDAVAAREVAGLLEAMRERRMGDGAIRAAIGAGAAFADEDDRIDARLRGVQPLAKQLLAEFAALEAERALDVVEGEQP